MSILSKPYFHDEAAAFKFVETVLWPNGPVCPECGSPDRVYPLKGIKGKPLYYPAGHEKAGEIKREAQERIGLYKCGQPKCKRQFTVRVGTVFESSHVPLHKWLQAVHLLCSSKKGFSAHQLHRVLECQYKTALFMWGRIRLAMASGELGPFGSGGGTVEIDETYYGQNPDAPVGKRPNLRNMNRVVAMIDRNTKKARTMVVPGDFDAATVQRILSENIARDAHLVTDENQAYKGPGKSFASHETVNHSRKEYVRRGDKRVHTNTAEAFFGMFKRGMHGTYHHCSKEHLHRYVAEFEFRHNNRVALGVDDQARAVKALEGVKGKRLYYRQPV